MDAKDFAFQVRDVTFSYRETAALRNVSLSIGRGTRLALLGANGSGKSTLLRILGALSFPQSGSVSFFGEEVSKARLENEVFFHHFRRRVGFVFQNAELQLFNARVFDEVAFGPLQLGWDKERIRKRTQAILSELGIAHLRDRAPHRLSGGEKKRVALASVLVTDPDVLLLDEPITALDPASQSQMIDLLASWNDGSRTVVIATHELSAVERITDRCLLLHEGTIAAEGDPITILHDVDLLARTDLIRPQRHVHDPAALKDHPRLHIHERDPSERSH